MVKMSNISNETYLPFWLAPPLDAWRHHRGKLVILFTYYIIAFVSGQLLNWLCLLNINKTSLNRSARYLMVTQCILNTCYNTIILPYKAAILYLQRIFLPWPLKIFCGWLHLTTGFGSMFLQDVTAITRVLYIVFPMKANTYFNTKRRCLIVACIPVAIGSLYAFPSLGQCCYRFYEFTVYSITYVGPKIHIQLVFSCIASLTLFSTLTVCYTWVIIAIKKKNKVQAQQKQNGKNHRFHQNEKKEIKLAALFGVTGGVWLLYLGTFFIIQLSGLLQPYSVLSLVNEMLEQFLGILDPIVYIAMSSELQRTVLKMFGVHDDSVHTDGRASARNGKMMNGLNNHVPIRRARARLHMQRDGKG